MKNKKNKFIKTVIFLLVSFTISLCGYAENKKAEWISNPENSILKVCFSPKMNCEKLIIDEIDKAGKEILVETYSFTSSNIAEALIGAKVRGVDVKVIADKTNSTDKYSLIKNLRDNDIPIYMNMTRSGIAHNKIMIIDEKYVLTGSYNWTNAAKKRNTENVILISDEWIAEIYKINWINQVS